jgi:hypothetical protein
MATSITYKTGDASTTVSYATYTILPVCGATVSYTYSVNGIESAVDPSFTFGTTSFTILQTDALYEGDYTIVITAYTVSSATLPYTDSQTITI